MAILKYLTPSNTIKHLGISKNFFYSQVIKDPSFPQPFELTKNKKVYDIEEIEQWIKVRKVIVNNLINNEGDL